MKRSKSNGIKRLNNITLLTIQKEKGTVREAYISAYAAKQMKTRKESMGMRVELETIPLVDNGV